MYIGKSCGVIHVSETNIIIIITSTTITIIIHIIIRYCSASGDTISQ